MPEETRAFEMRARTFRARQGVHLDHRRSWKARGANEVAAVPLGVGSKVQVISPVRVYHVPKHGQGLSLEGMVGEVVSDVRDFKGKEISATLPWKVQFELQGEPETKPIKFFAHLEEDEIELA